jgi:hypothetical protein
MLHDKQFLKVRKVADNYGCGYGNCKIIQTKNHIIFEFYNAGWSDNEFVDVSLQRKVRPTIDEHPISVYIFNKAYLDKESYEDMMMVHQKKYCYRITRD